MPEQKGKDQKPGTKTQPQAKGQTSTGKKPDQNKPR